MFAVEAPANSAKWFLENCLQNWLSLGKICSYGKRRYWENLKERESKREGIGNRLKANFKQVALVFLCPNCSIIFYPNTFLLTIENFILARVTLIHLCSYLSSGWVLLSGLPSSQDQIQVWESCNSNSAYLCGSLKSFRVPWVCFLSVKKGKNGDFFQQAVGVSWLE